jgi:3-methyladenine DNA glycosylase AlkD
MGIFYTFRAAADAEKAASMSAYMRDPFPFLGIPAPERKKLSRGCLESLGEKSVDWDFIFECWRQPEREFQYLAKDCLSKLAGALVPSDIPNLRELGCRKVVVGHGGRA